MSRTLHPATLNGKSFPFNHTVEDNGFCIEVRCENQYYSAVCRVKDRNLSCSFTNAPGMPPLTFTPAHDKNRAHFGFEANPRQMQTLLTLGENAPAYQAVIFLSGLEDILSVLFSKRVFYVNTSWLKLNI